MAEGRFKVSFPNKVAMGANIELDGAELSGIVRALRLEARAGGDVMLTLEVLPSSIQIEGIADVTTIDDIVRRYAPGDAEAVQTEADGEAQA